MRHASASFSHLDKARPVPNCSMCWRSFVLKNLLPDARPRMRSVGRVGTVGGRFIGNRHCIRIDIQLLHAGDERSAFKSEAGSCTIWPAHAAIRISESADNLVTIDLTEDATDRLTPGRSNWRVLSGRLWRRMTLNLHKRHG